MNPAIVDFMEEKRVALLGVSRSGKKFGNVVLTELKNRGYEVLVIHPEAQEIAGERCYPSLSAVTGQVDRVIICVQPRQAAKALREAAQAGIQKIWLQRGSESPEVLAVARETGVTPITGKCVLLYARPVKSLHAWHRAFARLTGTL